MTIAPNLTAGTWAIDPSHSEVGFTARPEFRNPAGQIHGGIAQGAGQALMEDMVYDRETGQILTGSFMDYAMPRASDVPNFVYADLPTRATTNPLGVKGCGEAGCAGSLTSIMNAIIDGLSVYGIRHIDMPATPHKVWQAIEQAKRTQPNAA